MAVAPTRLNIWKSRSSPFVIAWAALAAPAIAQSVPAPAPPIRSVIDENGVDLSRGTFNVTTPGVSIGAGPGALSFSQTWTGSGWRDTITATLTGNLAHPVVSIGGISESFTADSAGNYTADQGNGASLTYYSAFNQYKYVGRDGTRISFSPVVINRMASNLGTAEIITTPDGNQTVYRFHWANYLWRTISISNDYGYQIRFSYASDNPQFPVEFGTITKAVASNGIIDYCSETDPAPCNYSRNWPSISFALTGDYNSGSQTVTDAMNNVTRYTYSGGKIVAIKRPGSTTDTIGIGYDANLRVNGYNNSASNWTYTYVDAGSTRTTTRTNVAGKSIQAVTDPFNGILTSYRDENNHTTSYLHDSLGRLTRVTAQEGNYVGYGLDARGNVSSTTYVAKGGSVPNIVTLASFPATCTVIFTCNKPQTTTDAKGNVTNYTYDPANGNLLTVAAPAVTGGRPTTTYSYTPLSAYFKRFPDGSFSAAAPISTLTGVTICRTAATCPGNVNENKSTYAYGTPSTPNNLLLTAESHGAGNGSLTATTNYGYDPVGNRLTIDGPNPGSADTTRFRYDMNRQLVGIVGPDPDGAGTLKNRAQRYTYNADGRVTLIEQGTTPGQADNDWAQFNSLQEQATGYDNAMRPYRTATIAGGIMYTLTEFSYDALGRPDCVAVRMNQPTFGSVTPACTQVTPAGGFGRDRILKYGYDAAGQVLSVTTGYGTTL